jgi:tetratricopeptide (TPR) repeat protein
MRLAGTKPSLLRKRANAWRDVGFRNEALADYDQALKYNDKDSAAYSGRAELWRRARQFDKSLADIDAAITNDPKSAILRVHKGNILLIAGQDKEANRAYEQAAAIDARVLSENRFRDLKTFDRRGLYVINRTNEAIRFHVLFFTRTGTDLKSKSVWYPGEPGTDLAREARSFVVEPGDVVQPFHDFSDTNRFPVRGSKVRIWGEGVNSGRPYVTYKDQDLNLVPEGTYKNSEEERYYYTFE